jgi:hypothetical protein
MYTQHISLDGQGFFGERSNHAKAGIVDKQIQIWKCGYLLYNNLDTLFCCQVCDKRFHSGTEFFKFF